LEEKEENVLGESKFFNKHTQQIKPTGKSSRGIIKDNVQFSTKNVGVAVIRSI